MKDVLFLPVKPKWADLIVNGVKTFELRRRLPRREYGGTVVIYAASPQCEIVGTCTVTNTIYGVLRHNTMTTATGLRLVPQSDLDAACVSRAEFAAYFGDRREWYGLALGNVNKFAHPIALQTMRDRWQLEPPQQWRYIDGKTFDEIVEAGR